MPFLDPHLLQLGVLFSLESSVFHPKLRDHIAGLGKMRSRKGNGAHISNFFSSPVKFKKLELKIKRAGKEMEVEIPIATDETWALPDRGWILASDTRRVKASDPAPSGSVWTAEPPPMEVFLNIRGMLTSRISIKSGPFTIAKGPTSSPSSISRVPVLPRPEVGINLAVVNFTADPDP